MTRVDFHWTLLCEGVERGYAVDLSERLAARGIEAYVTALSRLNGADAQVWVPRQWLACARLEVEPAEGLAAHP